MTYNPSQSISVAVLNEIAGFQGRTSLGWTSAEKLASGDFKLSVLDTDNGKDRETVFFLDSNSGKVTFGSSELTGTADSPIPFEPEPVFPPPFSTNDIVTAIREHKEEE